MDFSPTPLAQALSQQLEAFMQRYLLPYNAAWHRSVQDGVSPPPFLEDLKALARLEGLLHLFPPSPPRAFSDLEAGGLPPPRGCCAPYSS